MWEVVKLKSFTRQEAKEVRDHVSDINSDYSKVMKMTMVDFMEADITRLIERDSKFGFEDSSGFCNQDGSKSMKLEIMKEHSNHIEKSQDKTSEVIPVFRRDDSSPEYLQKRNIVDIEKSKIKHDFSFKQNSNITVSTVNNKQNLLSDE